MDFLRDPILEGIAAFITILGAIVAITTFLSPTFRDSLRGWLIKVVRNGVLRLAILASVTLILGIAIGLLVSPKDTAEEVLPLHSQVAVLAWNALGEREYEIALSITEVCINSFEVEALELQAKLSASGEPSFAIGKIKDSDTRSRIFSNGVLNEVAACYIVRGDALKALNCWDEAREAYQSTYQFPHARIWDPQQEIFWSPTDVASQKLAELP